MANPRRGLKSAVNRDRLGGRDRAPADVGRRAAAADRDSSDLGECPIGARQSAEKPPAARKKQTEITKKMACFTTRTSHRRGKSGVIYQEKARFSRKPLAEMHTGCCRGNRNPPPQWPVTKTVWGLALRAAARGGLPQDRQGSSGKTGSNNHDQAAVTISPQRTTPERRATSRP